MENRVCFGCGEPAVENHHVIPESLGGTKTVPLCLQCHSLIHGKDLVTMRALSREAIKRFTELKEFIRECVKEEVLLRIKAIRQCKAVEVTKHCPDEYVLSKVNNMNSLEARIERLEAKTGGRQ